MKLAEALRERKQLRGRCVKSYLITLSIRKVPNQLKIRLNLLKHLKLLGVNLQL